mmetsp:Transcript_8909/g.10943  ORF Transcript_8909/g.10943 Transcript_8909/m.10943 type:complete len:119 (+) Transcript_8909:284-640(+)
MRRYSDDNDDPIGVMGVEPSDNYRIKPRKASDSDDEEELARGADDPLSLEELDGWMNQINSRPRDDSNEDLMPTAAEEEAKQAANEDTSLEVEYLKKELEDLTGGGGSPFEKVPVKEY